MGAKQVVTFVCAVAVVGDVVLAEPYRVEVSYEAPAPVVETDGAEVIETTAEVVS